MVTVKRESKPRKKKAIAAGFSLLSNDDLFLFNEGSHFHLYEKLGSHLMTHSEKGDGVYFSVWAPDADYVSVIGDFNGWNKDSHPLYARQQSGIWEAFFPGFNKGILYKYHIRSRYHGFVAEKQDPYGIFFEIPPKSASIVWDLEYDWSDQVWMQNRKRTRGLRAPISIYEVHLGSWMRTLDDAFHSLSYREIAEHLVEYVKKMGFTHIELLPVMEHPFFGSWGYQVTGYFAPSGRYGTPQDFMYMIDRLHQNGIGVILDWVPSHFPTDSHSLGYFDGTHLYEHSDVRQSIHPDWNSYIFNYGRNEIRSFLISSAFYWLDKFHVDGIRVDAVASMLYLDYSRKEGEWVPNEYGGRENLQAIYFLQRMNQEIYKNFPDVDTFAEESTAWPMVSRPTYLGGLGFGFKWDMGWMHDTLLYMRTDPIFRKYHHNLLTFRMLYAYSENFVLPLSHDEVVHGKGSLLSKMPGDYFQKFANLRLLFGYMYGQPAKKMLFMGGEMAQWDEWKHDFSLQWELLQYPAHAGVQQWVADLNRFYREENAMYVHDCDPSGFEWVDCNDWEASIISFLRKGLHTADLVLCIYNFTPVPRSNYRIGVPVGGFWREALNSDACCYGGSGVGNMGGKYADPFSAHGHAYSLELTLPPLAALFLTPVTPPTD